MNVIVDSSLLIDAFNHNIKTKNYGLAKEILTFLPKEVADCYQHDIPTPKVNTPFPKREIKVVIENLKGLQNSSVDWEKHFKFGLAGNCFVCGRAFTREESKMMGIGPICGSWNYSFDPHLPENKEQLEKLKRKLREKMLTRNTYLQYEDLFAVIPKIIGEAAVIGIIRETANAIYLDINGISQVWIPKKSCVFYFGAFFVQLWKAKEITTELARSMN